MKELEEALKNENQHQKMIIVCKNAIDVMADKLEREVPPAGNFPPIEMAFANLLLSRFSDKFYLTVQVVEQREEYLVLWLKVPSCDGTEKRVCMYLGTRREMLEWMRLSDCSGSIMKELKVVSVIGEGKDGASGAKTKKAGESH